MWVYLELVVILRSVNDNQALVYIGVNICRWVVSFAIFYFMHFSGLRCIVYIALVSYSSVASCASVLCWLKNLSVTFCDFTDGPHFTHSPHFVTSQGGDCEEASRTRVKCAWGKFRELAPFLS